MHNAIARPPISMNFVFMEVSLPRTLRGLTRSKKGSATLGTIQQMVFDDQCGTDAVSTRYLSWVISPCDYSLYSQELLLHAVFICGRIVSHIFRNADFSRNCHDATRVPHEFVNSRVRFLPLRADDRKFCALRKCASRCSAEFPAQS